MVGLGGLEPPTSPLSGAFKVLYAQYFLREERRSPVARASRANNPTRSLYDKAGSAHRRLRASASLLDQTQAGSQSACPSRRVYIQLGCTELDRKSIFPLRGTKPVLSL